MLNQAVPEHPGFFATLDRRYHVAHVFAVAILVAAAVALFVLYMFPRPAYDATADLLLSGNVPSSTTITVTPVAGTADNLTLAPDTTVTALKVADVLERSNWPQGYTLTVTSANLAAGSRCTNANAPCLFYDDTTAANDDDDVAFTLYKDAVALDFTGVSLVTWSDTSAKNKAGTTTAARVSYSVGSTLLTAGAYTDTLTFTITAK